MFSRIVLSAALLLGALAGPPAVAHPRDKDQQGAWRATREGRFLPLRTIESMILPRMRGAEYLGPELDVAEGRYRLKFMRGGDVIWIDVDARTGQVLGQFR